MKIGSDYSALGLQEGIHWHINPDVRIEYAPEMEDREVIPWIRYSNLKTGESYVYSDQEYPPDSSILVSENIRLMDCMDCHNRPSHEFYAPPFFTDNSLTAGDIPKELPDIKHVAMDLLYQVYDHTDSAMMAIKDGVDEYYELMYPDIFKGNYQLIEKAIEGIQDDFSENMFPGMKVRWDEYPNHLGHINSNGCHRCHDDRHVSPGGKVISRDCNLCHTIVSQGFPGELTYATVKDSLEFVHPVDIDQAWKEYACVECHLYLY
jgi:hypothetical protein